MISLNKCLAKNQYDKHESNCTVWKFQDFSIIQILCEINFVDSRSTKTDIFAILGAVNFVKPSKSEKIHKNQNSEPLNVLKWQFFGPQTSPTLISRKIRVT